MENIEITGVAAEGNAIARVNDTVVFIPYGAPGDIADIKIDRKKRSYAEGHIERLTKPSDIRIEPFANISAHAAGAAGNTSPTNTSFKTSSSRLPMPCSE